MELTCDKIVDILDVKCTAGSIDGYTLQPGIYEISGPNWMLKSLFPIEVKRKNTIDGFRLRSNITPNWKLRFTEKSFFYTISGFTESHSRILGDIESSVQLIPRSNKSSKTK